MSESDTTANILRVSIVEDDDDARARLANSVAARPELQLVAEYRSGGEALAGLADSAPDVLLVDLGLGDMSGLDQIRVCILFRNPIFK